MGSNPPKDYTSTIMRMAGNIAAGMVGGEPVTPTSHERNEFVAKTAYAIAKRIVEITLANVPLAPSTEQEPTK